MSGGGSSPAPAPAPAPLPAPTYRADDGTMFSDMDAYNGYNKDLREKTFQGQVKSSLNNVTDYAKQKFSSSGIGDDTADLDTLISGYQNKAKDIPDLDPNPSTYLSNTDVDNFLTNKQNTTKKGYTDSINGALPSGIGTNTFGPGFGASNVSSYLDGLQQTIDQELDNANKRGQLDTAGMGFAKTEEARQRGVGQAHLSQLANDLGTTYASGINTARDNAFTAANNWTLGSSPVDTSNLIDHINSLINTDKSGFGNAFTAQADGYDPFNINQILLKAGIGTGPTNSQGDATAAAIAAGTKDKNQPRGLGTTGNF